MNDVTNNSGSVNECFISVDVETSGPIPGEFSLLSIGACVVPDDEHGVSNDISEFIAL